MSAACSTFSETSEITGGSRGKRRRIRRRAARAASTACGGFLLGLRAPASVVQQQVHVAVGEVGGDQVKVVEVGALDRVVERAAGRGSAPLPPPLTRGLTRNMKLAAPCGSRSHSTVRRPGFGGRQVGEVDRRRGLPDAALDVVGRVDPHRRASPQKQVPSCAAPPASANAANRRSKAARAICWMPPGPPLPRPSRAASPRAPRPRPACWWRARGSRRSAPRCPGTPQGSPAAA